MRQPDPALGLTAFLIEKDFAGFSIGQKIDKMGMRCSPTAELVFNDCFVADNQIMGPLNSGVKVQRLENGQCDIRDRGLDRALGGLDIGQREIVALVEQRDPGVARAGISEAVVEIERGRVP